jgi:hypothetical protein
LFGGRDEDEDVLEAEQGVGGDAKRRRVSDEGRVRSMDMLTRCGG